MRSSKIINIGCGIKTMPNAVNIDIIKHKGVNIVCDITKGIPLETGAFDKAIADYVLCQIEKRKDFVFVMNEIWRILKPKGELAIRVPNAVFPCAFQDPMDCRYFTKETFDYFNAEHYRYKAFNYGFKPWKVITIQDERTDRIYAVLKKKHIRAKKI